MTNVESDAPIKAPTSVEAPVDTTVDKEPAMETTIDKGTVDESEDLNQLNNTFDAPKRKPPQLGKNRKPIKKKVPPKAKPTPQPAPPSEEPNPLIFVIIDIKTCLLFMFYFIKEMHITSLSIQRADNISQLFLLCHDTLLPFTKNYFNVSIPFY